ncbi:MAG: AI-2E family transporter [Clostridia bacterium]|nr:AI-2E family transporter [Clostridia bacterium]
MKITWSNCFRVGLSVFVLYLCIYYWQSISGLLGMLVSGLTPVVVGFAIAYVLNILMSFYERHYFPKSNHKKAVIKSRRPVCLTAAIVTLLAFIALVLGLVVPQLINCISLIISKIPDVAQTITQSAWVQKVLPQDVIQKITSVDWVALASGMINFLGTGISGAVNTLVSAVASVFSTMVTIFLSLVFAVYILASKEKMKGRCRKVIYHYVRESWLKKAGKVLHALNESFHRYIVGQCTEAVILGVLCAVGMWIFGFPYAAMIGALVGFLTLIPVAGAYIGAAIGALLILPVSPIKALLFLLFILVLQQLEGNIIYPRVVGSSVGMPAFMVLASITVGGALFGIVGMLVAVPLTATVYRLVKENMEAKDLVNAPPESTQQS